MPAPRAPSQHYHDFARKKKPDTAWFELSSLRDLRVTKKGSHRTGQVSSFKPARHKSHKGEAAAPGPRCAQRSDSPNGSAKGPPVPSPAGRAGGDGHPRANPTDNSCRRPRTAPAASRALYRDKPTRHTLLGSVSPGLPAFPLASLENPKGFVGPRAFLLLLPPLPPPPRGGSRALWRDKSVSVPGQRPGGPAAARAGAALRRRPRRSWDL